MPEGVSEVMSLVPFADFTNNYMPKRLDFADLVTWHYEVASSDEGPLLVLHVDAQFEQG